MVVDWTFQSTPSGGKATNYLRAVKYAPEVSIHAFRGEGDLPVLIDKITGFVVSIHAFRGEGDLCAAMCHLR